MLKYYSQLQRNVAGEYLRKRAKVHDGNVGKADKSGYPQYPFSPSSKLTEPPIFIWVKISLWLPQIKTTFSDSHF